MRDKKKTARLWEDSIVLALRDAQWKVKLRGLASEVFSLAMRKKAPAGSIPTEDLAAISARALIRDAIPPGFVKLDGSAESALADTAMRSLEGNFFLIEVKPSKSEVRDEWKPRKRKTELRDGEVPSKAVFPVVKALVDGFDEQGSALQVEMLFRSARCHHVAYWVVEEKHAEKVGESNEIEGAIKIEPYFNACITARTPKEVGEKKGLTKPENFSYVFLEAGATKEDPYVLLLDEMMSGECTISLEARAQGKFYGAAPSVGLPLPEFKKYVDWLVSECTKGGGGAQPLNFIVLSTSGFFQIVSDTTQLGQHLELASQLGTRPGVTPAT